MNPRISKIVNTLINYEAFTSSLQRACKSFEEFHALPNLIAHFISGDQHAHRRVRYLVELFDSHEKKQELNKLLNNKYKSYLNNLEKIATLDPLAQVLIGLMHEYGVGMDKSPTLALHIYENAAATNDIAQYYLAKVSKTLSRSSTVIRTCLYKASQAGVIEAKLELAKILYPDMVTRDEAKEHQANAQNTIKKNYLAIEGTNYTLASSQLIASVTTGNDHALIYLVYILYFLCLHGTNSRKEWFMPCVTIAAKFINYEPQSLTLCLEFIINAYPEKIYFSSLENISRFIQDQVKQENEAARELTQIIGDNNDCLETAYLVHFLESPLFLSEKLNEEFNIPKIKKQQQLILLRSAEDKPQELKKLLQQNYPHAHHFETTFPPIDKTYIVLLDDIMHVFSILPLDIINQILQYIIGGDHRIALFTQVQYEVNKERTAAIFENTHSNLLKKLRLNILSSQSVNTTEEILCDSELRIFVKGKIWVKKVPFFVRQQWLLTEKISNGVISCEEGTKEIEKVRMTG